MKKAFALVALMLVVGCDKKEAAPTASTAAATPAPSAAPAATSAAAAPSAAPAPSAEKAEAEEEYEQEGLEKGEVIVGWLQDEKDPGQCAALPAKEAEKDKFDAKKIEEVAKMMKAKVVPKCPTELLQGTCKMMGMLVNYKGPEYTPDTAQAHCKKNRGKWFD
ncbi:MAG: hypothetical protein HS104_42020 [Polyangiaceae bacterium]|nr:hypothetical protein [Polyangiaceae bacterium]MBK9001372.1 hypothetical protein [Myxococcales bacterium]MCL4753241.1 hypothetical protein [Myxococcales bacterium]